MKTAPASAPNAWRSRVLLALLAVAAVAYLYALDVTVLKMASDFDEHLEFAKRAHDTGDLSQIRYPHPLYELLTIFVAKAWPWMQFKRAGILVAAAFYVLLAWATFRELAPKGARMHRNQVLVAGIATMGLLFVGPIHLFTWAKDNLYLGYISPSQYHNPSMPLLKPLSVLLFVATASALAKARHSAREIAALGALVVLNVLAKPSYIICLIPAVGLIALRRQKEGKPIDWKTGILGFGLPALAVLGWQFSRSFLGEQMGYDRSYIVFAPFGVVGHHSSWIALKFAMSIVFPALVLGLHLEKAKKDLRLTLSWLAFAFGALYMYFFAESGWKFSAGNFFWGAQLTLFLLFIESARFFLKEHAKQFAERPLSNVPPQAYLCILAFAVHVFCGLVSLSAFLAGIPDAKV